MDRNYSDRLARSTYLQMIADRRKDNMITVDRCIADFKDTGSPVFIEVALITLMGWPEEYKDWIEQLEQVLAQFPDYQCKAYKVPEVPPPDPVKSPISVPKEPDAPIIKWETKASLLGK